MFSIQDHFPGTLPRTFSRDGFRYNFRDVPQTRFRLRFPGALSGAFPGTLFSGAFPETSYGVAFRSRFQGRFSSTFPGHVLPEPFFRTRLETFSDTFADASAGTVSPEPFSGYVFRRRFLGDVFAAVAGIARRVKYHS